MRKMALITARCSTPEDVARIHKISPSRQKKLARILKASRRFSKVKAGEWVAPKLKGYLMKCCRCGLVHRFNFKVLFQTFLVKPPLSAGRGK